MPVFDGTLENFKIKDIETKNQIFESILKSIHCVLSMNTEENDILNYIYIDLKPKNVFYKKENGYLNITLGDIDSIIGSKNNYSMMTKSVSHPFTQTNDKNVIQSCNNYNFNSQEKQLKCLYTILQYFMTCLKYEHKVTHNSPDNFMNYQLLVSKATSQGVDPHKSVKNLKHFITDFIKNKHKQINMHDFTNLEPVISMWDGPVIREYNP